MAYPPVSAVHAKMIHGVSRILQIKASFSAKLLVIASMGLAIVTLLVAAGPSGHWLSLLCIWPATAVVVGVDRAEGIETSFIISVTTIAVLTANGHASRSWRLPIALGVVSFVAALISGNVLFVVAAFTYPCVVLLTHRHIQAAGRVAVLAGLTGMALAAVDVLLSLGHFSLLTGRLASESPLASVLFQELTVTGVLSFVIFLAVVHLTRGLSHQPLYQVGFALLAVGGADMLASPQLPFTFVFSLGWFLVAAGVLTIIAASSRMGLWIASLASAAIAFTSLTLNARDSLYARFQAGPEQSFRLVKHLYRNIPTGSVTFSCAESTPYVRPDIQRWLVTDVLSFEEQLQSIQADRSIYICASMGQKLHYVKCSYDGGVEPAVLPADTLARLEDKAGSCLPIKLR